MTKGHARARIGPSRPSRDPALEDTPIALWRLPWQRTLVAVAFAPIEPGRRSPTVDESAAPAVARAVPPAVPRAVLSSSIRSNLAGWRQAERELLGLTRESPAWTEVRGRLIRCRSTYLDLFDRYLDLDRPLERSWFSTARQTTPALLPGPMTLELLVTARR